MKTNQILGIAAVVLLVLSGWTYRDSVTRAERFERGQKLLPNLNPDEIAQIKVTQGEKGAELRREGDAFVVVSAGNYPATNESVNRFLRDVLDLSLEKEVGKGTGLEEELELEPKGEGTTEVVFKNASDQEMVHFLVGKGKDDGGGNFVMRTDGDDRTVYLTSSRVYLRSEDDEFLKKDIVDVTSDEIAFITGGDFQIARESPPPPAEEAGAEGEEGTTDEPIALPPVEGDLKLANLPAGKKESSKVGTTKSILSHLRFTKHHVADAEEVRGLRYDARVQVDLKDDSVYLVEVAKADEKHYLRIQGFHRADRNSVAENAVLYDRSDEEVRESAETLSRIDEIEDFNRLHGSWVYEVSETTADKFRVRGSELVEDA